jgi:hypothetical protein
MIHQNALLSAEDAMWSCQEYEHLHQSNICTCNNVRLSVQCMTFFSHECCVGWAKVAFCS